VLSSAAQLAGFGQLGRHIGVEAAGKVGIFFALFEVGECGAIDDPIGAGGFDDGIHRTGGKQVGFQDRERGMSQLATIHTHDLMGMHGFLREVNAE